MSKETIRKLDIQSLLPEQSRINNISKRKPTLKQPKSWKSNSRDFLKRHRPILPNAQDQTTAG